MQLENLYNTLIDAMLISSNYFTRRKKCHKKRIVGWNLHCKDLHSNARHNFLVWHNNGRLRSGETFEAMKTSRARFKRAVKFCKNNENMLKKEILLSKFISKKPKEFWKEVRRIKGSITNSKCIDGHSNPHDVVKIFDSKYRTVLDNSDSQTNLVPFVTALNNTTIVFSVKDVDNAIMRLKSAVGHDDIHTKLLINAGPCFRNLLCKLMNKFLSHGFLPHGMLLGKIRPTVKNSAGNKTSSSNYRPVMNSSNILKTFEYLILPYLEKYLNLSHNQFAYRSSTGCLNAITLLKETISHYNQRHSDVFCAMIDLSQAYDQININTLCTTT